MTEAINENGQMPDHVFRYVEKELYSYKTYKAAIAEMEKDLADLYSRTGGYSSDPRPSNKIAGDPCAIAVVKASMIEGRMQQMLARVRKIEAGLELLSPEEMEIVELKYFSRFDFNNEQVIDQLRMHRNRFYRLRVVVIERFAKILGVI